MSKSRHRSDNIASLNLRLPNELKEAIERAAILAGISVTDFAINSLVNSANEVLDRHQLRALSDRDRDILLILLDADDEPNNALRSAVEAHRGIIVE